MNKNEDHPGNNDGTEMGKDSNKKEHFAAGGHSISLANSKMRPSMERDANNDGRIATNEDGFVENGGSVMNQVGSCMNKDENYADIEDDRDVNKVHSLVSKVSVMNIKADEKKVNEGNNSIAVIDYKCQQGGMGTPTISALGSYQGWQLIEVTVDSGACDAVMQLWLCSDIVCHESEQQRSGLEYEVANGASIRKRAEAGV